MKTTTNLAQEILDCNNINTARQMLSNVSSDDLHEVIISLQQLLFHNYKQNCSSNSNSLFRLQILEQITYCYGKINGSINGQSFKTPTLFDLIAVCKGYSRNGQQKDKIRSHFIKNIKKENQFWGISRIEAFRQNLVDKSCGYWSSWSAICHEEEIQKLKYFVNFYEDNLGIFSVTTEIRYYVLRYILILRNQNSDQKQIYERLIKIFFNSPYHYQILSKNFRFCLQFFRNGFNEKESLYYPQKNILALLTHYKNYEIQQCIINCSIGLTWRYQELSCCIVNCIKLGITQNNSRIIKCFILLAKNHQKYSELIKVFESNTAKLFIFMKHAKLFGTSFDLLQQFIIGPPPSTNLYSSFIDKINPLIKVLTPINKQLFLQFLQIVKEKYKQTVITTQIDTILQQQSANGYLYMAKEQITKKKNYYDWRIFDKKNKNPKQSKEQGSDRDTVYRGLTNIGNSCYMNSFIQSLFMTKQFRKQVLKVSTLSLEKQVLSKITKQQNDKKTQVNQIAREHIRPLAEVQRLFSLLLKSQRVQINPQALKSVGPVQFRNNFQQDSIQYGRNLLEIIHKSTFPNLFSGKMLTKIECQLCKQSRSQQQQFVDLMLTYQKESQNQQLKDDPSIESMLNKCLEEEHVSHLTCDKCNQISQNSVKSHWISKPPNYLILTIKRFDYDVKQNKNVKKHFKLQITQTFHLHDQIYQIYAIIVHRGTSANSGHYFTFGREIIGDNSRWICFNDSTIDIMSNFERLKQFLDSCPQDTPYIVFSQKLSHVKAQEKELQQIIHLRAPLLSYVQKDNMQFLKSSKKNPLVLLNLKNMKFDNFFKREDGSDDQNGGMMGNNNFPPPII